MSAANASQWSGRHYPCQPWRPGQGAGGKSQWADWVQDLIAPESRDQKWPCEHARNPRGAGGGPATPCLSCSSLTTPGASQSVVTSNHRAGTPWRGALSSARPCRGQQVLAERRDERACLGG